jgi:phosphate-selective porin OprO/OprP
MKRARWISLSSGAALAVLAHGGALAAEGSRSKLDKLEKEVDELKEQIQDLKAGTASKFVEVKRAADEQPKVTLDNGRPTFKTADGDFSASLRVLVQADGAYYIQDNLAASSVQDLSSGTNFRRARIGLEGTLYKDWDYSFIADLGGSGQEGSTISQASIQYNGFKPLSFRVGAYPVPIGLDDTTPASDTIFLERASPAEISRATAGGDGRMAASIIYAPDRYNVTLSYSGAKVGDAAVFDEQQAVLGRLAALLVKTPDANVLVEGDATYVFDPPDATAGPNGQGLVNLQDRPELRIDAARLIATGNIDSSSIFQWSTEAAANWKNLFVQGGYFRYEVQRRASILPDPTFDGWYAQASWVLTGEPRRYDTARGTFRAPKVAKPLSLGADGGLGALELAVRYSETDLNFHAGNAGAAMPLGGIRGGEQEIWTFGLNWYASDAVRFAINYQLIDVDRLNAAGARVGQDAQALSGRAQFSF